MRLVPHLYWVRDGVFEIEHGGVGVRAVQSGAFRRESKAAHGKAPYREIYALRRLTLAAVNYNTSIGLESSS
jgi:hypothetical protein